MSHQSNPVAAPKKEGYVPFLPDELIAHLSSGEMRFTVPVSRLIVQYVNDYFFGPEQWRSVWNAIPVTLPSIGELRKRVMQMGLELPRPLKQMNVEECANFVGELGQEEQPESTDELRQFLNRPLRPKEKRAGFTCSVTYIPAYIRQGNRVMAVTSRTLAIELGPRPTEGHYVARLMNAHNALSRLLTRKDAYSTSRSCYFVMEQDCAPDTMRKHPVTAIAQIKKQKDGKNVPEARNFLAAVFSRRAWQGEFQFGRRPWTYTLAKGRNPDGFFILLGGFGRSGLQVRYCGRIANDYADATGAAASKKFLPKPAEK